MLLINTCLVQIVLFYLFSGEKAIEKLPITYAFLCSYSYCGLKLRLLHNNLHFYI